MSTYADLITPKDAETLRAELIDRLEQASFPVTAWQAGNTARTLVQVDAVTLAELYGIVAQIGKGWSLDDAEGPWLTLHALSRYSLARILATFAKHTVRLTVASGAGPYSLTAGQLVVVNPLGVRFRSTNTGTLALAHGTPVDVEVQAEASGTTGNTAPSAVVTPALAGVSMAWQSRDLDARDEERDSELRQRCRDRWATLALNGCGTREAYRYHILAATLDGTPLDEGGTSCGVTRVAFASPPGDGTVPIWIAGATGLLNDTQRNAVRAYVDDRKPLTDTPGINHATEVLIDVSGLSVRFKTGQNTGANRTAVIAAVDAFVNDLDISTSGDPVIVDEAGIKAAVYAACPGKVRDVDWSGTDVTLAAGEVAVPDGATSITFSE